MKDLRRNYLEGGTFFFTVVTHLRQPVLCRTESRNALRTAILRVQQKHPFEVVAWVLLPDHLHCIWSLPIDDVDYSIRWNLIKRSVSYQLKDWLQSHRFRTKSQVKKKESGLWQHRFWEHTIRDEADLVQHFDYIHFNPVKHGLVETPELWNWSTFHKYQRLGYYDKSRQPADHDVGCE